MRIIVIHGTKANSNSNWFPWLKEYYKNKLEIVIPDFPTPENQSLTSWTNQFNKIIPKINSDDILIGHSIGAVFILELLQKHKVHIAIFISGFLGNIDIQEYDLLNQTFFINYDFEKIKRNINRIYTLYGEGDPYVSIDKAKDFSFKLNSELTIIPNGKHLNLESGFSSFYYLSNIIDKELSLFDKL